MHEAGLLAAAVADALAAAGPGSGRPVSVEIRVHDPIHVAAESARLHAELALRARGWADVAIEVVADPVDCLACGVSNVVAELSKYQKNPRRTQLQWRAHFSKPAV